MHRDGRIEPLTALAEIIGVVLLGAATGCFIFARHKFRTVSAEERQAFYRDTLAELGVTPTAPYRP